MASVYSVAGRSKVQAVLVVFVVDTRGTVGDVAECGDVVPVVLDGKSMVGVVESVQELLDGDQQRVVVSLPPCVAPEIVCDTVRPVMAPVVCRVCGWEGEGSLCGMCQDMKLQAERTQRAVQALATMQPAVAPPVVQPKPVLSTGDGPCWLKHVSGQVQGKGVDYQCRPVPYTTRGAAEAQLARWAATNSHAARQWSVVPDAGRVVGIK